MKRKELLRHLRRHSCFLKREGGSHSLWVNPGTGSAQKDIENDLYSNVYFK